MKDFVKRLGAYITEAGIAGAPMIPLFIFVTSFIEHEGEFSYVLPFVLFYAFSKTGEYTLGVLGKVEDPFKVGIAAAIVVAAGAVVSLSGEASVVFYDIGATLIGFGVSIFAPMYRTARGFLEKKGSFRFVHADLVGFLIMTAFSGAILLTQGQLEEVIVAAYTVIAIVSGATLWAMSRHEERPATHAFDFSKHDFKKAIPALILLGLVFFVRLFKQTANAFDVIAVLVLATAIMAFVTWRHQLSGHEAFEARSAFYFEYLIFVILWCVFWYIAKGNIQAVLVINLLQFAGQFAAMAAGKKILRHTGRLRVTSTILLLVMLCGLLFLTPSVEGTYACVFLLGFLSKLGGKRTAQLFREHKHARPYEYSLMSQENAGMGIIAGQVVLVCVLSATSLVMLHDSSMAMAAYALRISPADISGPFEATKLICTAILWVQGIALLVYTKMTDKTLFLDPKPQSAPDPDPGKERGSHGNANDHPSDKVGLEGGARSSAP